MLTGLKFYAYIAAALALASFLAYGVHVVKKANRTESAEAALVALRKEQIAAIGQIQKTLADSQLERQKLQTGLTEISRRFNSIVIPPAKVLVRTVQVPGEACPHVGVSADFVSVFNQASNP